MLREWSDRIEPSEAERLRRRLGCWQFYAGFVSALLVVLLLILIP